MTIRVHATTRDVRITEDQGTLHVMVGEKAGIDTLGVVLPPCQCPRHHEPSNPDR